MRVAGMVLVAFMAVTELFAQRPVSVCITTGFEAGGSIIAGTISALDPPDRPVDVTVTVGDSVRGGFPAGKTLKVPVDWRPGTPILGAGPGAWYRVQPRVGQRVLVMFPGDAATSRAMCVVDMDAPGGAVLPLVKRMVALDETPANQKTGAMLGALSDSEVAVRNMAILYLTSPSVRDPQVRLRIFQQLAPAASDPQSRRRIEAIEYIEHAYDGFSVDSDVNYQILSFLTDRVTDSDSQVRSIAVQFLDSKLSWHGKRRVDPARIKVTDPAAVKQQLQKEIANNSEIAEHARRLLGILK